MGKMKVGKIEKKPFETLIMTTGKLENAMDEAIKAHCPREVGRFMGIPIVEIKSLHEGRATCPSSDTIPQVVASRIYLLKPGGLPPDGLPGTLFPGGEGVG
jgi:hypothetical protein